MALPQPQPTQSQAVDDDSLPEVVQLSYAEGRFFFDEKARSLLGISGEEFLRRLDAGEYDDIEEDEVGRKIVRLIMAVPFVRPTSPLG